MPGEIATAWVRIVPTVVGIQGAMATAMAPAAGAAETAGKQSSARFAGGLKGGLGQATGMLVGVFAAKALYDGVSAALNASRDLTEAASANKVVFGSAFGSINKWATGAATALGQSKVQALDAAKTFGIFGQSAGLAGGENVKFAKGMTGLATDLASFNNTRPEDAVLAIGAALRGESEPIRRYGVLLDDATLRNRALKLGLIETTKDALKPQQRVLAAQAEILAQTTKQQGDFARTSGDVANQQRIFTATTTDLAAKIGSALLPVLNGALTVLIPLFGWLGENQPVLLAIAAIIGVTLVAAMIAFAASVWTTTVALLASPITWVILGLIALVAAIVWVATKTTFFQDVWNGTMKVIGAIFTWLYNSVIKPIGQAIGAIWDWLYKNVIRPVIIGIVLYIAIWAAIVDWLWKSVISPVMNQIGSIFRWLYENIIVPVVRGIEGAIRGAGAVVAWLWSNAISPALNAIGAGFNWVYNSVIRPVANFINDAIRTVGDVIHSVFGGIASFIGGAFQNVVSVVRGPINALIGMVNGVIGRLNGISVKVPDWVPGMGGQSFGVNIPRIPSLAKGGIVMPTTGGRIVQVAEARQPEAIIPLNKLSALMDMGTRGDAGGTLVGKLYLDSGELLGVIRGEIQNSTDEDERVFRGGIR